MFNISELFIQCNTHSCCETCVCMCVCLCVCVSIYWPLSVLCLYFCVSDIKSETSKKPNYVSDLSKGPSGTKVPGLDMSRSIDP